MACNKDGIYDMTCQQGATFTKSITWKDSAGDPVDLTGYTARMQVRADPDTAEILELTTSGGITLGGVAGTIALLASAATTAALAPGIYRYDLELVSGAGVVTRLLQGRFIVDAEITHD